MSFYFNMLPYGYSITVEEQAGKRASKKVYVDELSKKVPERRDTKRSGLERDPRLACLLSLIIPGGGHIYLRSDLKGVGFCLFSATFYGLSGYYIYSAIKGDYAGTEKKSRMVISGLLFVVAAIVHVVGIVEAYNDAIEINEKRVFYGSSHILE